MKTLGYAMVSVGTVGAALAAVSEVERVHWAGYGAALAVMGLGLVLVYGDRRRRREVSSADTQAVGALRQALAVVQGHLSAWEAAEVTPADCLALHRRIDEQLAGALRDFAAGREVIRHQFGLDGYADVMSHFAAGERAVHRLWSASADGYLDEVRRVLPRARGQFDLALARLDGLRGRAADS